MGAGDARPDLLQDGDERFRFVLTAVIGVEDLRTRVVKKRGAKRLHDERCAFAEGDRQTHDPAGEPLPS
jgi:hypothetical protein